MAEHVVLVEDEIAVREMLAEHLRRSGFECTTAETGEEALTLVNKHQAQVLVADIKLPGMDGLDLTEKVKKQRDPVVIVITGLIDQYSYEQAVTRGADDFILKPIRPEELVLRVSQALRERRIRQERARVLERVQKLAITDDLTKLYNARFFNSQAKTEMDRADRYRRPLSLLMLDIDMFKQYNDRYGHVKGDTVLLRVGKIIMSCCRSMDTAYRYGGEEFTVILPETSGQDAVTVAERIRRVVAVEQFHPQPGQAASVTVSIGVTQYAPREDLKELVQRSDTAMYESKQKGRNRVTLLMPEAR